MPSSLIIVALVVAWLLVLVPIVARRRQEVARTADSTLAARVVRSGGVHSTAEREPSMADETDAGEADTAEFETDYETEPEFDSDYDDELAGEYESDEDSDADYDEYDEYDDAEYERGPARPYRPGRGGFDAEAAALTARARYTFRQRIVVLTLLAAVITALAAITVSPWLWWVHIVIDLGLVGYLGYLRRQVRIEDEIRQRRAARLGPQLSRTQAPVARRAPVADVEDDDVDDVREPEPQSVLPQRKPLTRQQIRPGTVVVDTDDEDPVFADLDEPGALPYRRAVGE
jgi:hypothetical protein